MKWEAPQEAKSALKVNMGEAETMLECHRSVELMAWGLVPNRLDL